MEPFQILARIIHEGFYCNRRYAAMTSLTAGGLAAQSVNILFQVCLPPSRLRAPVSPDVSAVSSRTLVNNAGMVRADEFEGFLAQIARLLGVHRLGPIGGSPLPGTARSRDDALCPQHLHRRESMVAVGGPVFHVPLASSTPLCRRMHRNIGSRNRPSLPITSYNF